MTWTYVVDQSHHSLDSNDERYHKRDIQQRCERRGINWHASSSATCKIATQTVGQLPHEVQT